MPQDRFTVRAVVVGLELIILAVIAGVVVLVAQGKPVPTDMYTLAGTALGGLVGLLARTSVNAADPVVPAPVVPPAEGI